MHQSSTLTGPLNPITKVCGNFSWTRTSSIQIESLRTLKGSKHAKRQRHKCGLTVSSRHPEQPLKTLKNSTPSKRRKPQSVRVLVLPRAQLKRQNASYLVSSYISEIWILAKYCIKSIRIFPTLYYNVNILSFTVEETKSSFLICVGNFSEFTDIIMSPSLTRFPAVMCRSPLKSMREIIKCDPETTFENPKTELVFLSRVTRTVGSGCGSGDLQIVSVQVLSIQMSGSMDLKERFRSVVESNAPSRSRSICSLIGTERKSRMRC